MDTFVFLVAAAVVLVGAVGVIASSNPVHAALMLVMTLFGVAVLFVLQEAHFLAAVQVIVYSGAIVVLFLFVIMLLGVDRADALRTEPLSGQRPAAGVVAILSVGLLALLAVLGARTSTGAHSVTGELDGEGSNIEKLAEALFTDYLFAFEATAILLVIAVVGAVVLARRPHARGDQDEEEGARDGVDGAGGVGAPLRRGGQGWAPDRGEDL